MKCKSLKRDGTPCQSWAVQGFDKCFRHLSKEEIQAFRERNAPTKADLIYSLNRTLKGVLNSKENPIEKAKVILMLEKEIKELGGEPISNTGEDSLKAKIEKWKKEKNLTS